MLHTEIVSAVQEGLKLIIVVNDNHGFGCIHNLQRGSGGRSFGNEFRHRAGSPGRLEGKPVDVDFAKHAESLGATGLRAETLAELTAALTTAKAAKGTVVIHVPVRADVGLPGSSWWDVPVSATSQLSGVRAASKAYARATKKQKFYY
jgi:3D-(3,5/4)-trihydroxycyclohexane-1,2-dione acylhydrolase (decyclizing)